MQVAAMLVALAAVGIDYGWQPVAGGGIEYIIQIPPEAVDALRSGQDIFSDLPPELRGIRNYRITVGSDPLPNAGTLPPNHGQGTAPQTQSAYSQTSATIDNNDPLRTVHAGNTPARPINRDSIGYGAAAPVAEPQRSQLPMWGNTPLDPRYAAVDNRTDVWPYSPLIPGSQSTLPGQNTSLFPTNVTQPPLVPPTGQTANTATTGATQPPTTPVAVASTTSKDDDGPQWGALTASLLVLFLSLAGNFYLGMITWELRHRYRSLLARPLSSSQSVA